MGQTTGKVYVGWTTLQPGLWCDASHDCSEVGSYITFGRDMALAMPNDSLAIFLLGTGNVTMGGDWRSPSNGGAGKLYSDLLTGLRQAITDLGPNYQVEIAGMLWMQGESDAWDQSITDNYTTILHNFINDVRKDLSVPLMPFIIGMIDPIPLWTLANQLRPQQWYASQNDTNVGCVDTHGFPKNGDGGHYNAVGQMILGSSFAAIMQRLLKNPRPGSFVEPSDLVARTLANGNVKVLWRDNSGGETGFKVERKAGAGSYAEIASIAAGNGIFDSFVDNSTAASMLYSYRVRAINASSSSAYSNEAVVLPRGAGNGLRAQYFSDVNLSTPVLSRVDTAINFSWNGTPPGLGLSSVFSARWTGFIQPRYTDEYGFFMNSDMVGKVWIDNRQIVNQWSFDYIPQNGALPIHAGTVKLTAGQLYPIKVEYYVMGSQVSQSHAILKWQSMNYYQEMQVVPRSQLYQDATPILDAGGEQSRPAAFSRNHDGFSVTRTASGLQIRVMPGSSTTTAVVSDMRGRTIGSASVAPNATATLRSGAAGIRVVSLRGEHGAAATRIAVAR